MSVAVELERWCWYARDAIDIAEREHARRVEHAERLEARADAASLAAQQLGRRCDDMGQRIASVFAAIAAASRRAHERATSLDWSLARADVSVAHWTAQVASAARDADSGSLRRVACERALAEAGVARQSLVAVRERHTDVEATVRRAEQAAAAAAAALQEARAGTQRVPASSAAPVPAVRRALSDARGHLDGARAVHHEARGVAAAALATLAEITESVVGSPT